MTDVELRPFTAADRDWMVQVHIDTYERDEGFDASFGVLIGQILDDFLRSHDPQCERGWIAWDGDVPLGSIFCVRIGRLLLETCTDFARVQGYATMKLWTHKSHEAANTLYLRNGWEIIEEKPVFNYGQSLIERVMQLKL